MVPKISPARESARSCFDYDIRQKHGQPRGEWIAGTLQGTPRQMARMAGAYRSLRPDCKKPVWRCSLSLPPSDGRPAAEKWAQIAEDFLAEMEVPVSAAWVAVHHGEVDHDHIHITLLRTLPDGSLWNEERSAKRAIKACQKLEVIHQLANHDRTPKPKNAPTRAETEIFNRQQKKGQPVMSREHIQSAVDQILLDYPPPKGIDFVDLQRLLADMKPPIDLQASMPKGVFRGVSYQYDSFRWPGSKLGRDYSVGLIERGVRMPTTKTGVTQPPEIADPFLNQAEQPASPAAKKPADKYLRAPAPLRQMLRDQHQQRQVAPTPKPDTDAQPTKKGWDINLAEVDRATANLGPLTYAMAMLGAVCIKYSLEFLRGLIAWLKKLLSKLGLGLRETRQQLASGQQGVAYEPFTIEAEMRRVPDVDAAAQIVHQITEALETKNASFLPEAEGRGQIAAGLVADKGREPASANFLSSSEIIDSQKSEIDEIFESEISDMPAPIEPKNDAVEALRSAVEAQKNAETAAQNTPKVAAAEVLAARQLLANASTKLTIAKAEYQSEKLKRPKLLRFAFPAEKDALSVEIAAEAAALAVLSDVTSKHPSKPPKGLTDVLVRARLKTIETAKLAVAQALQNAAVIVQPEVKKLATSRANALQAQVELLSKFPTTSQAGIVLNTAESAITFIAEKLIEVGDLARLEAQRVLQNSIPRNLESNDFEAFRG